MTIFNKLFATSKPVNMVSALDLKQSIDNNDDFILLDVRTQTDYLGEQSHIKGSTLIPVEKLKNQLDKLGGDLNKKIITICRTDRKSSKAYTILTKHGFSNVAVAKMGMTDWLKHGFDVA